MEPHLFPEVTLSSPDLARMVYFVRGIADPDAIGKSVFSDNYSLVIRRRNTAVEAPIPSRGTGKLQHTMLIEGFDGR